MTNAARLAAEEIVAKMRAQYNGPHRIVQVQEDAFPHLDLGAYAGFRSALEKRGYRLLAVVSVPPSIDRQFFPYGTPVATLLSHHLRRIGEISGTDAQVRSLFMASYDDVLQMDQRQKALKDGYRASRQWVTRDELRNMAHGKDKLADAVYEEVQKLVAAERKAG